MTAGLADWLTGWLAAGWLAADKFVPGVLIQRMNSLNSMATNSLLSLSPEQRAMLVAAATEAVPERRTAAHALESSAGTKAVVACTQLLSAIQSC